MDRDFRKTFELTVLFFSGHSSRALTIALIEISDNFTDLSQRVDSVKEENLKLKSENQVLGQYIENLMAASSVFQSTSPKTKKK